jgi:hypothetical protein
MPADDLSAVRVIVRNICQKRKLRPGRSGRGFEAEAAGLAATLHAFLVLDVGTHEP